MLCTNHDWSPPPLNLFLFYAIRGGVYKRTDLIFNSSGFKGCDCWHGCIVTSYPWSATHHQGRVGTHLPDMVTLLALLFVFVILQKSTTFPEYEIAVAEWGVDFPPTACSLTSIMCLLDYHVSLLIWLNPAHIRITMSVGLGHIPAGKLCRLKSVFFIRLLSGCNYPHSWLERYSVLLTAWGLVLAGGRAA